MKKYITILEGYRKTYYQQEPAHCGIVLVSRLAGFPDKGSLVLTCNNRESLSE